MAKFVGLGIYAAAKDEDVRNNLRGRCAMRARDILRAAVVHYGSDGLAFVAMGNHGWSCARGNSGELLHTFAADGAHFITYNGCRA
jgi:hypothetical protein